MLFSLEYIMYTIAYSTHGEKVMEKVSNWRAAVTVVRGTTLTNATRGPSGLSRATAFNFTGGSGQRTWVGAVSLQPGARTGAHHHGRHEVALYVAKGQSQILWGERLEFTTEVATGDFVYFAPYVPHEERNLQRYEAADFVVVRTDNERIFVPVELNPVTDPEKIS
jgi:uncharacterized RmlC-like cupin family protein